jgi:hypothetical protein
LAYPSTAGVRRHHVNDDIVEAETTVDFILTGDFEVLGRQPLCEVLPGANACQLDHQVNVIGETNVIEHSSISDQHGGGATTDKRNLSEKRLPQAIGNKFYELVIVISV